MRYSPSKLAEALSASFLSYEERHLEILARMVALNSFTRNPQGVDEVGRLTAALFEPLGFKAQLSPPSAPYGSHLALVRQGRSGQTIGMISHLDTVFTAEEEQRHDFRGRIEGGRFYGPGSVDIKGGTLLIYMVLSGLKQHARDAFEDVTWVLLLNAAEEEFTPSFFPFCVEHLGDDALACLVFEYGREKDGEHLLVHSRKGRVTCRVEVEGRAGHAGSDHARGANAILQLAELIVEAQALTDYSKELTVNVGMCRGGEAVNRVPHYAEAQLEMRAFDDNLLKAALERLRCLERSPTVSSSDGKFTCKVRLHTGEVLVPWSKNDQTDRLYRLWAEMAPIAGMRISSAAVGGGSDGNSLWIRYPTLDGLGPGGANLHCSERSADGSKDQEYLTISTLAPKAVLNCLGILNLLQRLEQHTG